MKRCSAEEAAALLRPRDTMILGFGPAQPGVLLEEMGKRDDGEDLTVFGGAPAPALSDFREVGRASPLGVLRPGETPNSGNGRILIMAR